MAEGHGGARPKSTLIKSSTTKKDAPNEGHDDEKTRLIERIQTLLGKPRSATSVAVLRRKNDVYPSIVFHNTSSLNNKFNEFSEEKFGTDIIAVVETWFKPDFDRRLKDGYVGFFCDRSVEGKKGRGGGCALWLSNTCKKKKLIFKDYGPDPDFQVESLCVKFEYKKQYFALLNIYSPQNLPKKQRTSENERLIEKMFKDCEEFEIPVKNYIIMGDFNGSLLGEWHHCFTLYGFGPSQLDKIFGTNPDLPYHVRYRDPLRYNTDHSKESKETHKIIELY